MALRVYIGEGMPMPPANADFAFIIDFKRGEGDPRRIFDAASALIDGFETLDEALAGSIDAKLQTVMVLEDVESGSLKVWLRNVLRAIPDDAIKGFEWKKAVGHYLLKSKYVALEFLDNDQSGAPGQVDKLREELRSLASGTDARHLPDYPPIHDAKLVASLDRLQDAKRKLGPEDRLLIETDEKTYEVDLSKTWDPSDVIPVTNATETRSDGEIILTVRKPDYLGDTMWQFSHGKTSITAPIVDEEWLTDWHARRVPLLPGDALKCRVTFIFVYDENGTLIDQKMEITKVLQVIQAPSPPRDLFDRRH